MSKTSLITGATAGIGYELSRIFAKNGYNLVLVSRDKKRLETIAEDLKNKNDIQVKVISKDLCKSSAPGELYDNVKAVGIDINVLVNNAGFGINGKFTDFSAEKHMDLLSLLQPFPKILRYPNKSLNIKQCLKAVLPTRQHL
jgi:short-subunit dehydrogenase